MIDPQEVINIANEILTERFGKPLGTYSAVTIRSRQIRAITEALCSKINEELDCCVRYTEFPKKSSDKKSSPNHKMKFIRLK
jgi:predicted nucleic acid-binding OB-fold protein